MSHYLKTSLESGITYLLCSLKFLVWLSLDLSNQGINQLLIFSDASVHCYATAVYLRSVEENSIKVFAKTRLVPVAKGRKKCTKLTIPRLELMGVLIGVRAANLVAVELKLTITERILWTDSQCVLHWLKTRKPLSVFVENRVRKIRSQKIFIILLHSFWSESISLCYKRFVSQGH